MYVHCLDLIKGDMKCVRSFWENSVRETQSAEANFGPLKGEKDDVYRAVRTINAMESLKVMPVRY